MTGWLMVEGRRENNVAMARAFRNSGHVLCCARVVIVVVVDDEEEGEGAYGLSMAGRSMASRVVPHREISYIHRKATTHDQIHIRRKRNR